LKIESGKFQKTDNAIIDSIPWFTGLTVNFNRGHSVIFVKINRVIPKEPKTLVEARGIITSDYQNYLERMELTALRKNIL